MDSRTEAPIAFAHRGARAERRENTLEAFSRALELGATGLESDAWMTRDGTVVLDHDGVTGPPWRRQPISGQDRSDLPRHIPALSELYANLGGDYELSLDVKDPACFGAILDTADRAGAHDRLWLCDDDPARLARWAGDAGNARLVCSTHLARIPGGLAENGARWAGAGIDAVNLHGSEWNPERVAQAHRAGLATLGWDAQSQRHIERLIRFGVDGIFSDHVDRLVAAIRELTPGRGLEAADTRGGPHLGESPADEQLAGDRSDDP